VIAYRWGWLYFARLPQWHLPSPPGLGGPRATQECCRAPYDLSVACFSVVGLYQRLSLFVGFVSPYPLRPHPSSKVQDIHSPSQHPSPNPLRRAPGDQRRQMPAERSVARIPI
jgi:hypothetical protein